MEKTVVCLSGWVDVGGEGREGCTAQCTAYSTHRTVLYVSRSVSRDQSVNWTGESSHLTERITSYNLQRIYRPVQHLIFQHWL